MRIIKYKLHKDKRNNLIIPEFIEDGGYFKLGNEYIGLISDEINYYMPKTNKEDPDSILEELTRQELINYVKQINLLEDEISQKTELEVEDYVNEWCDKKFII